MHAVRVLLVEDDADQRDVMARFVRLRGYETASAGSVSAALRKLERERFDVIVLDWTLRDGTAAELIAAAGMPPERLLVVSGEERPPVPSGVEALRKPLDARVLAGSLRARARCAARERRAGAEDGESEVVDLVLFVRRGHSCDTARLHLEQALKRNAWVPTRVEVLEMDDGVAPPLPGGRPVLTPMLLRRAPLPKAWISGDLSDPDLLDDLLLTGAAGSGPDA